MDTLQQLNLTENDFKMLVDGLDALPEKGLAGEMMGDLIVGMMTDKSNPEAMEKVKKEREMKQAKAKKDKETMVEDIKILQGKLLMLKRYLQQQGALNTTYDILNHVK